MSRAYTDYLRSIAEIDTENFDDDDIRERMAYLEEMIKGASHYIDQMAAEVADLRLDKQNLTAQANGLTHLLEPVIGLLAKSRGSEST